MRRRLIITTLATVLGASLLGLSSGPADAAAPITAKALLTRVSTAAETTGGYNRAAWKHWVDADHDRCDTRKEVLIAESTVTARVSSSCAVYGRWYSYYDGRTWTRASDVDIDHVVALAEAASAPGPGLPWRSSRCR